MYHFLIITIILETYKLYFHTVRMKVRLGPQSVKRKKNEITKEK